MTRLVCLPAMLLAVLALVFTAGAASAAVTHEYLSQITEVSAGPGVPLPGKLSGVEAMTVDSGHLYVAEHVEGTGNYRTDVFDAPSGAFESQFPQVASPRGLGQLGLGSASPGGEARVYLGAQESGKYVVAVFDAAGALLETWKGADTPSGSFGSSGFFDIAVNGTAGLVYVADGEAGTIDVLKPKVGGGEEYVTQLAGPEPAVPFSFYGSAVNSSSLLAVDPLNGDLLVMETEKTTGSAQVKPVVDVLEPSDLDEYSLVRRLTGAPGNPFNFIVGVASDGADGDIYVVVEANHAQVIDQFDSTGKYLGQLTGTSSGPFLWVRSVAVDPATRRVYVGDSLGNHAGGEGTEGAVDVFSANIVVPDVQVEPASNIEPTSATLNGAVNPDGAGEATCEFEYGTTTGYGSRIACTEPVANGSSPVPVQASVSGLEPDTTYHYRLDAKNANGHLNEGQGPENLGTFKTDGPGIESESASGVTASSATLAAVIDPDNSPTAYYFEYGTTTEYGAQSAREPVGSGEVGVALEQHLQGLRAGTLYHYRVVAVSQLTGGTFELAGADRTFVTQTPGGFTLPDGRAWELVSPPTKQTGVIVPIGEQTPIQAAADGSAISYVATAPTESDPQGYTNLMQVFSWRDTARQSWESQDIEVPHEEATSASVGLGEEYRFFSSDLSLSLIEPFGPFNPKLSEEATEATPYLRSSYDAGADGLCAESCFHPLVTGANVPSGTAFGVGGCKEIQHPYCGPEFVGGSSDLKYVVLSSPVALTSTHVKGALYEWHNGELRLVSILPRGEGETAAPAAVLGREGSREDVRGAISTDGSRIVWSSGGKLYLRDMAKGETGETLRLDGVSGAAATRPAFQFANSDDSRVFFTDTTRLTSDSGAGVEKPDLFECEIVEVAGALSCKLSDLTPAHAEESAGVEGLVIGGSLDGSYVYFAASGALTSGAVPGNCTRSAPAAARCNLYVWHNGATAFIASIGHEDSTDWGGGGADDSTLTALTARVSSNGHWLAFMSQRSLTGYDTRDAASGKPDEEVYLYDAQSQRLVCASCNPTGARPAGVELGRARRLVAGPHIWPAPFSIWLAADVPGWTPDQNEGARYQSRYLSDSGRLFFNSSDALVPQDVNGTWDVYEFEPAGVGGCKSSGTGYSATSEGCVGAVSSGSSGGESAFLDASESGGDVFFLTSAKLASRDYDTAGDVYDAHECSGGSPCFASPAPMPPACTTTEACRAAPTPQPPIFGSPSSATFTGAGSPVSVEPVSGPKARSLTRAQKLTRALKACQATPRSRRASCARRARQLYGVKRSLKTKKRAGR